MARSVSFKHQGTALLAREITSARTGRRMWQICTSLGAPVGEPFPKVSAEDGGEEPEWQVAARAVASLRQQGL